MLRAVLKKSGTPGAIECLQRARRLIRRAELQETALLTKHWSAEQKAATTLQMAAVFDDIIFRGRNTTLPASQGSILVDKI